VPRSSALYKGKPLINLEVLARVILANLVTFPEAGFRWMYMLLRRQRISCTRSQVRQVYIKLNMLGKKAPLRVRTTDSRHEHERYPNLVKDIEIVRPDQVWVADTMEFRIAGKKAFLALVEDVYTRLIMGFAISFSNDSLLTLAALEMGLADGTPEIHHSDQGKPYACELYTKRLLGLGAQISMAAVGCAWENGFAERLNRTVKENEIRRSEYGSLQEAAQAIADYVKLYNEKRMHMSLGFQTPKEVKQAYGNDPNAGDQSPQ
jgi:putative transposase